MRKLTKLISACLFLSFLTFNLDATLAITKSKKKTATKIEKVKSMKNKRVKYKSAFFGGYSRNGYSNSLFRGGLDSNGTGCQELSIVTYNQLSVNSCVESDAVSTAQARATEICISRGCRRAINVSVTEKDTSVPISGGNGRRYEYICGVVGNCTNRLF